MVCLRWLSPWLVLEIAFFLFEIDIFLLPLRKGTQEFLLLSQELFKLNANNRLNPIFEDLKD